MSVFDSIKKLVAGDTAHDGADAGNPVKIGGKAASSAPTAVTAGRRVNAYFDQSGRLVGRLDEVTLDRTGYAPLAAGFGALGHVLDRSNGNGANTTNDTMGRLRLGREQELVVMPSVRYAYASSADVTYCADILVSTTSAYNGYAAPTTAFFNGADAGVGAAARWVRIPMLSFSRGATLALTNTLGVSLNVKLLADIAGITSGLAGMRPMIASFDVASGSNLFVMPFPVHDTADAAIKYVPQLLMPMTWLTLELTPASDPSAGAIYLMVAR